MSISRFARMLFALSALMAVSPVGAAQAQDKPTQAQDKPAQEQSLLKAEELDALLAPIALYPDPLLAQVLMASTYPLEVVQAERWVKGNAKLKGDALKAAVDKQGWDDSVKALAATPSVLEMMSGKLDWTQKLGDAVLAQQPDVMDAIQRLRGKAQANNKLASTKQQKVVVRSEGGQQRIAIEPATPETIYVPYYNPAVVYGAWPYPAYPAYYFPPPAYIPGAILAGGLAFGAGYALGRWASGGNYWGGNINWNNNNINVNRPRVNPQGGGNWQHNPAHRQGVRYNNASVQQRFGNNNVRSGAQNRMDYRGRSGQQVLNPQRGQAGAGAGAGRTPAANRPATRPSGGGQGAKSARSGGQAGQRAGQAAAPKARSTSRPAASRGNAFANVNSGRSAMAQSQRGRSSMGGGGMRAGAGGRSFGGGGGGGRSFGGGGGGRGGGGRRSDMRLKHDIDLLGYLPNGIGVYRFRYNDDPNLYVGVLAQQVQPIAPQAVTRGGDGYLRVHYRDLGIRFQTYRHWLSSGGRLRDAAVCNSQSCPTAH